jgi:FKBP-type peptidyl-prolyl cis-trans isomerase FklB
MKTGIKGLLVAACGMALAHIAAGAESTLALTNENQKASYSIGMMLGTQFKNGGLEVDADYVAKAIKDVLSGAEPRLTQQQATESIRAFQQSSQAKLAEKNRQLGELNRKAGEAFLAENKKKDGIKTIQVPMPDGTKAELQYKVIAQGSGSIPKSNDVVTANYRGTLIDGKEFDSSAKHGGPLKMAANRVIRGWTEALERMNAGSKWEIFVPPSLAYGENAPANIGPGQTLIFEMELVSVEATPPPNSPQPLTSDIIRVPSAEERLKGAQPEIIKAEDVAKEAAKEAARQAEQNKK